MDEIKKFEEQPIRTVWDEEHEEWYFSVVDVVGVLTDSQNPTDYFKKMRKRDIELNSYVGTNCPQIQMLTSTGKLRKTLAGNSKHILRIIQSIPSKKAEPFKVWLAQVGSERIDETIDPEITIERALETYAKKGYNADWINQRLQTIRARKELTDEWQAHGIEKGREYAILTDEITKAWSGLNTRQYKNLKGLKKENLRDNMSTLELALNMLAEASTTELTKVQNPQGLNENKKVAKAGGTIAGNARKDIEAETGKPVITSDNAAELNKVVVDLIENIAKSDNEE